MAKLILDLENALKKTNTISQSSDTFMSDEPHAFFSRAAISVQLECMGHMKKINEPSNSIIFLCYSYHPCIV